MTSDQSNRLVTLASRDVSLKFDRDYDANRQTALLTRAGVHGDATGDYQCRDQNHHIGTQNHRALPPHRTTTSAHRTTAHYHPTEPPPVSYTHLTLPTTPYV